MRETREAIGRGHGYNDVFPYLAQSMPWSDLFRIQDSGSSGDGGGASPNGNGGGNGGTGPIGNGPSGPSSSAPSDGGPTRPIDPETDDLDQLERRLERLGGESFEPRQATSFPDYVIRSIGVPRYQLQPDPDAPVFVLIIDEQESADSDPFVAAN